METTTIVASAPDFGLDRIGVCGVEPFERVRSDLQRRKADGLADRLAFTFTDPERSTDITSSIPWARSLVVGATAYVPESGFPGPGRPGTGRIARFSTDDHYRPLRSALERVADLLQADGHRAEILVDDNRLVDRAAAVRAGIGWWGKNTMVLTHGLGPWILLGSVVTSAELEPTGIDERSCGSCSACLPACPTGALIAPGVLDARRCIAALLQQRGTLPVELREAIGDRIYGCDDCLEACPPGSRLAEIATVERGREDLVELLRSSDAELDSRFERFYVPGRKMRFLRRNMLVAAGNAGGDVAVDVLAEYARCDDELLVEHAIWALGRIGSPRARAALSSIDAVTLGADAAGALQSALTRFDAPIGK